MREAARRKQLIDLTSLRTGYHEPSDELIEELRNRQPEQLDEYLTLKEMAEMGTIPGGH